MAIMAVVSCNKELENNTPVAPEGETMSFIATVDGVDTKTMLGEDQRQHMWSAGQEKIMVFDANNAAFPFYAELAEPATQATFTGVTENFAAGQVMAVHPSGVYTADVASKTINDVVIPSTQILNAGTYSTSAEGYESVVSVAYSENNNLQFKNAVTLLAFQVKNDNVTKGSFYSNNQDKDISGTFTATLDVDNTPVLSSENQNHWVDFKVANDESVTLTPNTTYYIAIAPTALEENQGFSIEFNGYKVKEFKKAFTFRHNIIYNLGLLEDVGYGIVGVVNNWGNDGADVRMEEFSEGLYVARNVEIATDGAIKIRRNNLWADNANYGLLVAGNVEVDHVYDVISSGGSKDMTVSAGTYDIWLDKANNKVYVMTPGKDISEAKAPVANVPTAKDGFTYLKPGLWTEAGARFALYYWNASGNGWVDLNVVEGYTDYYEVIVPVDCTGFKFVRMNPATTDNNWDNKWNETGDLTVQTDGNNLFTITDWGTGSWSKLE